MELMPPKKTKAKMKRKHSVINSVEIESIEPPTKETILPAPTIETPITSPNYLGASKTSPRKVLRLSCRLCNDYPDGFRSDHELRRHTNRVHKRARKVWVTIDTSPDKTFLAGCKACRDGKRYNECYNAASHLRRMHFHPHKRGERKLSAAEARRGGKPGDLDPPMDVLKAHWLREIDEVVDEGSEEGVDDGGDEDVAEGGYEPSESDKADVPLAMLKPQPQPPSQPQAVMVKNEAKTSLTPTTPSTRSMAIGSIVD